MFEAEAEAESGRRKMKKVKSMPSTRAPASDMWAAGCIVYILLTGTHPFDRHGNKSDADIVRDLKHIAALKYSGRNGDAKATEYLKRHIFDDRVKSLSGPCLDLLRGLFDVDPSRRMTSGEFLRHPWTQGLAAAWASAARVKKLEAFWQRRFRAEVLRRYAERTRVGGDGASLSDADLAEIFHAMDVDGSGTLEPCEIEVVFRELGVSREDATTMFRSVDLDGSGGIDFDEFRAIMRRGGVDDKSSGARIYHRQLRFKSDIVRKYLHGRDGSPPSEKELRKIFDTIDLDGNGVLDAHEIRLVLRTAGEDEESISHMFASVDLNHDGGLSWDEFRQMMYTK